MLWLTTKNDALGTEFQFLKCKMKHFLGIEKKYDVFPFSFTTDPLYGWNVTQENDSKT